MIVKDVCFAFSLPCDTSVHDGQQLLQMMMRSILIAAPPNPGVASTTAGLRDDVGSI